MAVLFQNGGFVVVVATQWFGRRIGFMCADVTFSIFDVRRDSGPDLDRSVTGDRQRREPKQSDSGLLHDGGVT